MSGGLQHRQWSSVPEWLLLCGKCRARGRVRVLCGIILPTQQLECLVVCGVPGGQLLWGRGGGRDPLHRGARQRLCTRGQPECCGDNVCRGDILRRRQRAAGCVRAGYIRRRGRVVKRVHRPLHMRRWTRVRRGEHLGQRNPMPKRALLQHGRCRGTGAVPPGRVRGGHRVRHEHVWRCVHRACGQRLWQRLDERGRRGVSRRVLVRRGCGCCGAVHVRCGVRQRRHGVDLVCGQRNLVRCVWAGDLVRGGFRTACWMLLCARIREHCRDIGCVQWNGRHMRRVPRWQLLSGGGVATGCVRVLSGLREHSQWLRWIVQRLLRDVFAMCGWKLLQWWRGWHRVVRLCGRVVLCSGHCYRIVLH